MPDSIRRDIVVIGASAGGVDALAQLVSYLPADLPAALFVTVHVAASSTSVLPQILSRKGDLPAIHATNGLVIEQSKIYIAPPGLHLKLLPGKMELSTAAKENGHRPAIDLLFRSAARYYGERVISVVLTGTLDDGTAGAVAVSRCGGSSVVQDPDEAVFPGMPESAILGDHVDHILRLEQIADYIVRSAHAPGQPATTPNSRACQEEITIVEAIDKSSPHTETIASASPSVYTCPECSGTLFETKEGGLHFRCRVGHAYSVSRLASFQTAAIEAALWTAMRSLEESISLSRRLAGQAVESGRPRSAAQFSGRVTDLEEHARVLRDVLKAGTIQRVITAALETESSADVA